MKSELLPHHWPFSSDVEDLWGLLGRGEGAQSMAGRTVCAPLSLAERQQRSSGVRTRLVCARDFLLPVDTMALPGCFFFFF